MPSFMKFRATKLRTPFHEVVLLWMRSRSSNENVVGSDFTSQYRFSPALRGVKTQAHELSVRNGPATFAGFFFLMGTSGMLLTDRLNRLEQAVDAVAVELERVGEGQRYVTKVFAESRGALGAGAAEPIEVRQRDALRQQRP